MLKIQEKKRSNRKCGQRILICAVLTILSLTGRAQITVTTVQDFNFGTFYQGATGGTVEISATGARTATGSVVLMNTGAAPAQAIFDIEAPANSVIATLTGPDTQLTGSNGGTVTLKLGATDPVLPINTVAVPPDKTRISLAASLVIGDRVASPAGLYQGTFTITVTQE